MRPPILHVSQFVGDGKGGTEPVVLDDGATVFPAHCSQFRQTQSVTILARGRWVPANVLPEMANWSFWVIFKKRVSANILAKNFRHFQSGSGAHAKKKSLLEGARGKNEFNCKLRSAPKSDVPENETAEMWRSLCNDKKQMQIFFVFLPSPEAIGYIDASHLHMGRLLAIDG